MSRALEVLYLYSIQSILLGSFVRALASPSSSLSFSTSSGVSPPIFPSNISTPPLFRVRSPSSWSYPPFLLLPSSRISPPRKRSDTSNQSFLISFLSSSKWHDFLLSFLSFKKQIKRCLPQEKEEEKRNRALMEYLFNSLSITQMF